jgi:hypothetical protein
VVEAVKKGKDKMAAKKKFKTKVDATKEKRNFYNNWYKKGRTVLAF